MICCFLIKGLPVLIPHTDSVIALEVSEVDINGVMVGGAAGLPSAFGSLLRKSCRSLLLEGVSSCDIGTPQIERLLLIKLLVLLEMT